MVNKIIEDLKELREDIEKWDDVNVYVSKKYAINKLNDIIRKYEE